jgi:hypothetical protein
MPLYPLQVKSNTRSHRGRPVVYARFFRHDAGSLGTVTVDAAGGAVVTRYTRNLMFFWRADDVPFLSPRGPQGCVVGLALLSSTDQEARRLPHLLRNRARALALASFGSAEGPASAVVSLNEPTRLLLKWPLPQQQQQQEQQRQDGKGDRGSSRGGGGVGGSAGGRAGAGAGAGGSGGDFRRIGRHSSGGGGGRDGYRQVCHSWAWMALTDHEASGGSSSSSSGSGSGGSSGSSGGSGSSNSHNSGSTRDTVAVLARSCDSTIEFCLVTFPTDGDGGGLSQMSLPPSSSSSSSPSSSAASSSASSLSSSSLSFASSYGSSRVVVGGGGGGLLSTLGLTRRESSGGSSNSRSSSSSSSSSSSWSVKFDVGGRAYDGGKAWGAFQVPSTVLALRWLSPPSLVFLMVREGGCVRACVFLMVRECGVCASERVACARAVLCCVLRSRVCPRGCWC